MVGGECALFTTCPTSSYKAKLAGKTSEEIGQEGRYANSFTNLSIGSPFMAEGMLFHVTRRLRI